MSRVYRPADFITLFFLLFLVYITLLFHLRIPGWTVLMADYLLLLAALGSILLATSFPCRFFEFLHSFYPVLFIAVIFDTLGSLIHHLNPHAVDLLLIRIDYSLFGNHPSLILESIVSPILTELSYLAYTSYYILPTLLAILFYREKDRKKFDLYLTVACLTYYLSYGGYILFPAVGPRFTLAHLQRVDLTGIFLTDGIRDTLNSLEKLKFDAFPSGHTAIILVTLFFSLKRGKKTFLLFLIPAAGMIFSTVYCRYHYVIDVLAGIALASFCIYLGPKIHAALQHRLDEPDESPG